MLLKLDGRLDVFHPCQTGLQDCQPPVAFEVGRLPRCLITVVLTTTTLPRVDTAILQRRTIKDEDGVHVADEKRHPQQLNNN